MLRRGIFFANRTDLAWLLHVCCQFY